MPPGDGDIYLDNKGEPDLPCLVCGKELERVTKENEPQQPYDAVTFRAYGQYGSRIFDPVTRARYLEINVCDDCLIEYHERVLICHDKVPVHQRVVMTWHPRAEP